MEDTTDPAASLAWFMSLHSKPLTSSAQRYRRLVSDAGRREAVDEALASVRAEGLEPSAEGLARLDGVATGLLSPAEAREQILSRYRA